MARQFTRLQYKYWCFTINNPTPDDAKSLAVLVDQPSFIYLVYQLEKGVEGNEHFQGYIEFKRTMGLATVKRLLGGRAHLEVRRGTQDQARDYCMKKDTRVDVNLNPIELGTPFVSQQGSRTDIAALCESIKVNPFAIEISKLYPSLYIRYHKGIEKLCTNYQPERKKPPKVIMYYGTTGTGKTRDAFRLHKDVFRKAPDTRWFDGYTNQKTLLLDDFCGRMSKMSLSYLLQLLDRYAISVEVKCSYTTLLADTIVITTNVHPLLWYDYNEREEQYKALARRITTIMWYKSFEEPPVEITHKSFFDDFAQHCVLANVFKKAPVRPKLERQGGQMDLRDFVIIPDTDDEDSYEFP